MLVEWSEAVFKLTVQVTGTLFVGILLFVLLAKYESTEQIRYWPLFAAMACIFFIAIKAVKLFSYKRLLGVLVVSSMAFDLLYQLVGHVWFPGIVKDAVFFSFENAAVSFTAVLLLSASLFLCFASIKLVSNFLGCGTKK